VSIVFLVVLSVHVVYAVLANRRDKPERTWRTIIVAMAVQTPAFLIACWFGARSGAFSRDLVSPLHIAFGLLIGHGLFGLSLVAIDCALRDAIDHLTDIGGVWRFAVDCPAALRHVLAVSVAEELIWRVTAQTIVIQLLSELRPLAAGPWPAAAGIALVAVGFSVVHRHFFKNAARESVEFVVFSLLIGALYFWTESLILVVAVHAVRNLEIAYLEYQIKAEELGDPDKAMDEIERQHTPPRRTAPDRADGPRLGANLRSHEN